MVQAIVRVFETGKPEGDYGSVTVLADNAGITYGSSQATDRGGNLDKICIRYLDLGGPRATELAEYVARLATNDSVACPPGKTAEEIEAKIRALAETDPSRAKKVSFVPALMGLLKELGVDPVMREAQDQVFDEEYWVPAVGHLSRMELVHPLSAAAVYDTCIQSGPGGVDRMRLLFKELPPAKGGGEKAWTRAYLRAREEWLAEFTGDDEGHTEVVRKTVYRPRALLKLTAANNWDLETPLEIVLREGSQPVRVTA